MSWRLYGEVFETSDMSGTPRVFQPFICPRNKLVKAFRTWVIYYGNPTFTSLTLKIYSNRSSQPIAMIYQSDKAWTASEISDEDYAAKELYFDFTNPIYLKKDETYHAVLFADGYTKSNSSHLAWIRGYPNPNNDTDVTVDVKHIGKLPFYLAVIDGLRQ